MTRALGFRRHDYVEKQVGVGINQTGQYGGAAQINGLDAGRRVSLQLRRSTNLFDLSVSISTAAGESTFPVRGSGSPSFD